MKRARSVHGFIFTMEGTLQKQKAGSLPFLGLDTGSMLVAVLDLWSAYDNLTNPKVVLLQLNSIC